MVRSYRYLDIFAGAGGLSEGFVRAGFRPIAHVEMDEAACYTLKTRLACNWLTSKGNEQIYKDYLNRRLSREEFYQHIPKKILRSVLNYEITFQNLDHIFSCIDEVIGKKQLDLMVGGPPCQAYSVVGRARDEKGMIGDYRNYLYMLYAEFLKKYEPQYFVFENVLGLLSAKDDRNNLYFKKMQRLFKKCGYSTEYQVLNAADYGVLQNRRRVILIGKRGDHSGFYPDIPKVKQRYMVSEVFSDLPPIHAGEGTCDLTDTLDYKGKYLYISKIKRFNCEPVTYHAARKHNLQDLNIYKTVVSAWNMKEQRLSYSELPSTLQSHHNKNSFTDRFKVVASNLPYSQTVVAHIAKDGHYYIHPDLDQNRSITPREAARLQTFPDNYYFESASGMPSITSAFKQIGNAVPVSMAEMIARSLKEIW